MWKCRAGRILTNEPGDVSLAQHPLLWHHHHPHIPHRSGNGDDRFSGYPGSTNWGGCHLDPPGRNLGGSEAPCYGESYTGTFLRFLHFLRSHVRRLGIRLSDSGGDLQDPPGHRTFASPFSSDEFVKNICMLLSGAEECSFRLLLLRTWETLVRSSTHI
jgi:hypothetical protein